MATITTGPTIHSPVTIADRKKMDIRAGDTVRVWQKIQEKGKTRLQAFEGLVIAVKHGKEAGSTFTVRKVASGVGVEKIFPLYSPMIDSVETIKRAKVRRAKLYHIRDKASKEIRRQMRNIRSVKEVTDEEVEEEVVEEVAEETPVEEVTETAS
ncbi:MAG: 50S ribosomal protein L19 [Minisyncoccota bacterium]